MLVGVHKSFWISFTESHWWIDKSETELIGYIPRFLEKQVPSLNGTLYGIATRLLLLRLPSQSGKHVLSLPKSVLHEFYVQHPHTPGDPFLSILFSRSTGSHEIGPRHPPRLTWPTFNPSVTHNRHFWVEHLPPKQPTSFTTLSTIIIYAPSHRSFAPRNAKSIDSCTTNLNRNAPNFSGINLPRMYLVRSGLRRRCHMV
ncbi:hypothetical protein F5887DRAFT_476900 [Amanita rubescens]|nr:hypothetical protein F5887DRAFT_476900 [Amanita rubescens]